MTSNLRHKTISGLFWSFIDNFSKLGIQFIVGVILARILSPREFGLIGMLTIFIAISQTFIDSGFRNALIRKKHCSDVDYSTVFYFNLLISTFIYILLLVSSGSIAHFFEEPQLKPLLRVLGLGLIFSSLGIIHQTILIREIKFRLQTYATLIASIGSGTLAIIMAFNGYGVWSLVALTVIRFALISVSLWIFTKWRPIWTFSMSSFRELFNFGGKLLISSLINTIYQNIYFLIIGKFFSTPDLGFYTRADQFRNMPSKNVTAVIQRVSYPILSSIQDEHDRLKNNYKKLIKGTMFITFLLMLGMAAVAKPMILALIGEKWEPSVIYLQLLCLVGMFHPLQALNLNMLNVKGRSDLFLKLEIIKKLIAVPVIIIGIIWGIKVMILGMIANAVIAYIINSYYSGKLIDYPIRQQVVDIFPSFIFAIIISALVYSINYLLTFPAWIILCVQFLTAAIITVGIGEFVKMKDYLFVKMIIREQWQKMRA